MLKNVGTFVTAANNSGYEVIPFFKNLQNLAETEGRWIQYGEDDFKKELDQLRYPDYASLDFLLDDPQQALETFVPTFADKPDGLNISDQNWKRHIFCLRSLICELCFCKTGSTSSTAAAKPMATSLLEMLMKEYPLEDNDETMGELTRQMQELGWLKKLASNYAYKFSCCDCEQQLD
ncbi:hypothetical protein HDU76_013232 [Blyttiomyces sp. JEL0837]|nr:hypothetical protein HDU76_013232 [Blyttiomyces sp. JEL0837]